MKALSECCNGDGRPVNSPLSKVLCKECFAGLGEKMRALLPSPPAPPRSEGVTHWAGDGCGDVHDTAPPRSDDCKECDPEVGHFCATHREELERYRATKNPPRSEQETVHTGPDPIAMTGDNDPFITTVGAYRTALEGAARDAAQKEREAYRRVNFGYGKMRVCATAPKDTPKCSLVVFPTDTARPIGDIGDEWKDSPATAVPGAIEFRFYNIEALRVVIGALREIEKAFEDEAMGRLSLAVRALPPEEGK
jgi:hypothetical protein